MGDNRENIFFTNGLQFLPLRQKNIEQWKEDSMCKGENFFIYMTFTVILGLCRKNDTGNDNDKLRQIYKDVKLAMLSVLLKTYTTTHSVITYKIERVKQTCFHFS